MRQREFQYKFNRRKQRKWRFVFPLFSLLPPVQRLLVVLLLGACSTGKAQCYIDPFTGRQICTTPASGWRSVTGQVQPGSVGPHGSVERDGSTIDRSAHCRIRVGDGTTGSGALIEVNDSIGFVLTCSHLFDGSTEQIVATFPNGSQYGARLIERDRAHDLAALAIQSPRVRPLVVADGDPIGRLTACGFGPSGQFRAISGNVVGHATAAGAEYPSLTMSGAVRPGDNGGGVLNFAGQLVGVVWGQRDGLTYATCGRPLREFLDRIRAKCDRREPVGPDTAGRSPQLDLAAWTREMEERLRALDAKKQDKGHYLQAGDLHGYMRIEDAPKIDTRPFAQRSEVDSKLKTFASRFEAIDARVESVREHAEKIAASKSGFLQGLSLGKLLVGALGLSGPLAVAVIVASGIAGRRRKRAPLRVAANVGRDAEAATAERDPVVVDSPIPPQRTVPETHYVPIERDSFAKAHQWASEHVARKYPGGAEILQALDSLIKQFLAAK